MKGAYFVTEITLKAEHEAEYDTFLICSSSC